VPGTKLETSEPCGKFATIWVLETVLARKCIESSVIVGDAPKFCPLIVSVLCTGSTVVLKTIGNPDARATSGIARMHRARNLSTAFACSIGFPLVANGLPRLTR
jgi:hypothetical protein